MAYVFMLFGAICQCFGYVFLKYKHINVTEHAATNSKKLIKQARFQLSSYQINCNFQTVTEMSEFPKSSYQ